MKTIAALKEIFSELDQAAVIPAAMRSEEQCFAKV